MKKLFKLLLLAPCLAQAAASYDSSSVLRFVPGFGSDGYVVLPIDATVYNDIAIDSAGKIVVVGVNADSGDAFIARYNSNGVLDTSFGTYGVHIEADFSEFHVVKIDSSGNIVVGGTNADTNVLARYTTAGVLDDSFGTDGIAIASQTSLQYVYDFAFDSSGKIVVVGKNNGTGAAIARFDGDGAIDTGFGTAGYIDSTDTSAVQYTSIAIDESGNIIVAGNTGGTPQGVIAKYANDGTFDSGMGTVSLAGSYYIYNIKLDSSDKIVVAGDGSTAGYSIIARFNNDGSIDTSFFNSDGQVSSNTIAGSYNKLVIDTNGKIVLVGKIGMTEGVIARYDSDGWLDTTFNKTGYINVENGTDSKQFNSIGLDHKGRIVAVGSNDENQGLIVRYLANGTLDAAGNWNSNSLIEHFESQGLKLSLLSSGR